MKILVASLLALLLGSNAYWLFVLFDAGVSQTYNGQYIDDLKGANDDLRRIIPVLTQSRPRSEVVEIVSDLYDVEPFEKDGCVWIGSVGLKFSDQGKLSSVSKSWNFGEEDPCFPGV